MVISSIDAHIDTLPDCWALRQVRSALWGTGEVNGAAVMVGAGFSRFASLAAENSQVPPLWPDLMKVIRKELYPKGGDHTDAMALADEYRAKQGAVALENLIRCQVRDSEWTPSEIHHRLLSFPWSDVLTTNWDTLLERSVADNPDLLYNVILTTSDIARTRSPRIVKLHGSLPSHSPFIFTQEDFRTYPTKFAPFVNLGRQVLLENELCLIGFSGDDPNFLEWSGWVRDQLGTAARPIRLVGNLNLSDSRRCLLKSRNVTPIDLGPLVENVPEEDRHHRAIKIFFDYLENGKPPKAKWILSFASETEKGLHDSSSVLDDLTKAWAEEREKHPGWLVTPSSLRAQVRESSSSMMDVVQENLGTASKLTKAAILYETAWRWETAFCPMPEFVALAAFDLAAAGADDSLSLKQRIYLRTAIVREARHRRSWSEFDARIELLYKLNDCRATVEAVYERCLKARDELEYEFVAENVDRITGSDPVWLLRRAALTVDVMDNGIATKLVHQAYHEIRKRRAQNPRNIWLLSREAWALWLVWLARVGSELYVPAKQQDWPHDYRVNETDPRDEIRRIDGVIASGERQKAFELWRRRPKFDAGTYEISIIPVGSNAHRPVNDLTYIMECVGVPFHFNHVDALGSRFARALNSLGRHHPIDTSDLLQGTIANRVNDLDSHLSRVAVARLPLNDVRNAICKIRSAIEFGKGKLTNPQQNGGMNTNTLWTIRINELIELLSRFSMRLQGDDALNVARFGTSLSRELLSSDGRFFDGLNNLISRSIEALEPTEHHKVALDVLRLPLGSELGQSVVPNASWMKVISTLDRDAWVIRKKAANDADKAKWSARTSFLIDITNDESQKLGRHESFHLLARLFDANVLTDDEVHRFRDAIWKHTESDSFPSDTGLLPHVFLRLLSSKSNKAQRIFYTTVVSALASGSFEADLLQGLCSASFSFTEEYDCYKIPSRDARSILDHALNLRRIEQVYPAVLGWPSRKHDWILHLVGRVLAATALPSLSASKVGVRRARKLLDSHSDGSLPIFLEALPVLVSFDSSLTDKVVRLIQKGLISGNSNVVASSLNAVFWFTVLATENDIQIPDALVCEVVSMCIMRRQHRLDFALECARGLVEVGVVSQSDCNRLADALALLRVETGYKHWQDETRTSDVGLIRKEAIRLAMALVKSGIDDRRLHEWIENARFDEMPEVRYANLIEQSS